MQERAYLWVGFFFSIHSPIRSGTKFAHQKGQRFGNQAAVSTTGKKTPNEHD